MEKKRINADRIQKGQLDMIASLQQLVVWGVGLTTPAVFGLLSGIDKLKTQSALKALPFGLVYISALVLFALSACTAGIFQWLASKYVMLAQHRQQLATALTDMMVALIQQNRATQTSQEIATEKELTEKISGLNTALEGSGKRLKHLSAFVYLFIVAGTVCFILVLLSLRFKNS